MISRQRKLEKQFNFAGFDFPRYLAILPSGDKQKRLNRYKVTGGYYSSPIPRKRETNGFSFYLNSDFQPFTRWQYCDDVCKSIRHTGWFVDDDCFEKIRGIVCRLPHNRFLPGWTLGEGMASCVECLTFNDETECALYANQLAEHQAELEREYNETLVDENQQDDY